MTMDTLHSYMVQKKRTRSKEMKSTYIHGVVDSRQGLFNEVLKGGKFGLQSDLHGLKQYNIKHYNWNLITWRSITTLLF